MAKPELINSINILSRKIDSLLLSQQNLKERIAILEKENRELASVHNEDLVNLENANKKIEFLSLSHRLANSPEALVEARNKISQLIRTIDSCIRLLKQD